MQKISRNDQKRIINDINEYLRQYGQEYYEKHNEAVPVDSHGYALITIGIQNEAFNENGFIPATERNPSANNIIEIFTQPWYTGQTPDERVNRSIFEEGFYLNLEYYDNVLPDYERDEQAYAGVFEYDENVDQKVGGYVPVHLR